MEWYYENLIKFTIREIHRSSLFDDEFQPLAALMVHGMSTALCGLTVKTSQKKEHVSLVNLLS